MTSCPRCGVDAEALQEKVNQLKNLFAELHTLNEQLALSIEQEKRGENATCGVCGRKMQPYYGAEWKKCLVLNTVTGLRNLKQMICPYGHGTKYVPVDLDAINKEAKR